MRNHVSLSGWVLRYNSNQEEVARGIDQRNLTWKKHNKSMSRQLEPRLFISLFYMDPSQRDIVNHSTHKSVLENSEIMSTSSNTHASRPSIAHKHSQSLIEAAHSNGFSMRSHKQKASDESANNAKANPLSESKIPKKGVRSFECCHCLVEISDIQH